MSWFGGNTNEVLELEKKINDATSESIPNGEIDLPIALEITDLIRSKKVPAKQCMRALKKRLQAVYANPNLLTSTLKLTDLCVKNAGYHFLVELSSKEFMDYLVDFIFKTNYNVHDGKVVSNPAKYAVGEQILSLIQSWQFFFKSQLQLNYVEKCYNELVRHGYDFPDANNSGYLNGNFIDTETPADWVDGDECMICYKAFSMLNRQHHCRSCGGVFCQEHSSHNAPLVTLGIKEPVRVCDNCYYKIRLNNRDNIQKVKSVSAPAGEDEDDELRRAIELSLQESSVKAEVPKIAPPQSPPPQANGDDEDDEMKAAIAASLKEFESQKKIQEQYQAPQASSQPEPQSDFYPNFTPFSAQQNSYYQSPQQPPPQQSPNPTGARIESHIPPVEDLTPDEEETINKFIGMMGEISNDRRKLDNILYDKEINDIQAKVTQLKPKLNRSLRDTIERYDAFVALNNKISTITRLYDQFLESKLSQAYGNHSIDTGYDYNYPQENRYSGEYQAQIPPQGSGIANSAYPSRFSGSRMPSQSTGMPPQASRISSQSTGVAYQQPSQPPDLGPQKSGNASEIPATPSEPAYPTYSGYESREQIPQFYNGPMTSQPDSNYGAHESQPEAYDQPQQYPSYNQESEPNYEESEPQFQNIAAYPPVESIPVTSSGYPGEGPYPNYTTYPPPEEVEHNDTGASMNSANSRYPPIDVVTADYEREQNTMPPTSFPSAPSENPKTPPQKFVEEPLIEL